MIEKSKAFQTSKLRKFSTTKPALQYRLKELLLAENARERKDLQKINPKTIRKMVRESYILTITINVNGLNAPTFILYGSQKRKRKDLRKYLKR